MRVITGEENAKIDDFMLRTYQSHADFPWRESDGVNHFRIYHPAKGQPNYVVFTNGVLVSIYKEDQLGLLLEKL